MPRYTDIKKEKRTDTIEKIIIIPGTFIGKVKVLAISDSDFVEFSHKTNFLLDYLAVKFSSKFRVVVLLQIAMI